MISDFTKQKLKEATENPDLFCSGAKRKQLQVTYDKLLDELSMSLFDEQCNNRMVFRQKVNSQSSESKIVKSLKNMLKNQDLLFRKDYSDHADEINKFLTNDLDHFLKAVSGE